jgi:CBS domain-containing protein
MGVGELCCREVHLADPDETVVAAARRMRDRHVGTLVVLDRVRHPIGIVTDRDLVVRGIAATDAVGNLLVGDVMTTPVRTVTESTSIQDALAVMRSTRHRRLAVVDKRDHLAGIVSLDDVLDLLGTEFYRIRDVVATGPIGP